jgi:hypothetical protein
VSVTGTYTADLSYLRRGVYGTTPASHAIGDQFTLMDTTFEIGCTIAYTLPPQYIGTTVYFKFQSFNLFGNATQDMSLVTAYTYVPTGRGYGGGTGGAPTTPASVAVTPGSGFNLVQWTANPSSDNVTSYQVWAAPGLGQPFGSAVKLWEGLATSYAHSPITSGASYTYFVVAVNAVGSSSPSSGADGTGGTITYSLQVRGGTPGRKPNALEELFNVSMLAGDTLPIHLTGSLLQCEVAPTSNYTLTLYRNGSSIGTGTILAGATTGAWTFAAGVTFASGDFFKAISQTPQDTTLSGVAYTLIGTRTL